MTRWLAPVGKSIEAVRAIKSPVWDQAKELVYKEFALRHSAAVEFGRLNGWAVTRRAFSVQSIGRAHRGGFDGRMESWGDHRVWYSADRMCMAIVSQPYGKIELYRDDLDEDAAKYGLQWHLAPNPYASFHYPGQTLFIVMTAPGVKVKWLPEQTL
jgi:hypothetical protein